MFATSEWKRQTWRSGIGILLIIAWATAGTAPTSAAQLKTITTTRGTDLTINPERFHVYDLPQNRFETMTGIAPQWQAPELPLGRQETKRMGATGRVLTILVQWDNHAANEFFHPPAAYDSLLFSAGIYPTGSVYDYYQEVSYGTFGISGDVVGWVTLPSLYDGWYDINEIIAAVDPYVNFADYDYDNDGFVDALWLIHAGPGQEETHDPNDIWSHAYLGVNVPTADGVALNRWSMQPEEHMDGSIMSIRVFCHEYGHILGMPDLYDYDGKLDTTTYFTPNDQNDHPLVDWDVMGYYGYNIMSYGNRSCPSHYCAWSRAFLGWATPEIPSCLEGTYNLYNVELYNTQSVFKVPINDAGTEYFLLEYRNPRSAAQFDHVNSDFSAYWPWFTPGRDTLDQGLLITHIDENMTPNSGTPDRAHYAVTVVDAGYDPAQPWDGVSEFTEWWYPYEFRIGALYSPDDPGQTVLSPSTTPSSDGYYGPSGITIAVVAQNNDYLTVEIHKPIAPVIDPVAPVVLDETQSLDVTVTAADANCTTPSLSAVNLPPYATFADGGNGTGLLSLVTNYGDAGIDTVTVVASDGSLSDTAYVEITVNPGCNCPYQGDFDASGFIDAVDVSMYIDVVFFGGNDILDPLCPTSRSDFNADTLSDAVDLAAIIDHVYFNGAGPVDPCVP